MSTEQVPSLNAEQVQRAIETMREYLNAPKDSDGRAPMEVQAERDDVRISLIDNELKPLVRSYLSGQISLADFKTRVDGTNKRRNERGISNFWGFSGIKGQMFFNMMVNAAVDPIRCDQEMKKAIAVPVDEDGARSQITTFADHVDRIGEDLIEAGHSRYDRPRLDSVPFFLSYFWQIQDRDTWPVYYTSSVNAMTDMNLWVRTGEPADDYIKYRRIYQELASVFSRESKRRFGLYDVEHVFWFKAGNPYSGDKAAGPPGYTATNREIQDGPEFRIRLPESYVPPIVEILPRIARSEEAMREAATASGTSLDRAFEKNVHAAFTILSYETRLLGCGQGRVPDGLAWSIDDSYAILWDAKVRADGYTMGTDDRTIREYITTQCRELNRNLRLRNIYYVIVSSRFADDFDDAIRSLKMETGINEVRLMEADALVAMVDAKLRSPHDVTLGPDGLQRLFAESGVLTADAVREILG